MKEKYLYPLFTLIIVLALLTACCVAPPQENATKSSSSAKGTQKQTAAPTTTTASFVTEVPLTDDTTTPRETSGYTTFLPTTQIPADITCRIHTIDLFGYNGTAIVFNQKNAPMYINYTVVPTNITETKVYTNPNTKKTETRIFSDYSPTSWFEVTVRDNATGEIVLQDGFGEDKGYSIYRSRTLKVMQSGDLVLEFRASEMKKATASIWVKPIGNFEDSRLSEFTECTYWDSRRDSIPIATTTTGKGWIITWTPENKVTEKKK